jgi:hypothetical protein
MSNSEQRTMNDNGDGGHVWPRSLDELMTMVVGEPPARKDVTVSDYYAGIDRAARRRIRKELKDGT